ncbi:MAG TPA: DUF1801 domain-containing protein [Hanamia sp.]|nr:DUF1801 domain-containing protein [Hanamia sp.]
MENVNFKTVEEYISGFPENVKILLQQMRETIIKAAPKAQEVISYQMPAYKYLGILVYFAGYKNHIGFYPTASGIEAFKNELSKYKGGKGSVQFPLDKPLPLALISKIVKFKLKENMRKAESEMPKAKG